MKYSVIAIVLFAEKRSALLKGQQTAESLQKTTLPVFSHESYTSRRIPGLVPCARTSPAPGAAHSSAAAETREAEASQPTQRRMAERTWFGSLPQTLAHCRKSS